MELLEQYAEHAKGCRSAAAKAPTSKERENLLRMADRWESLARQRAAQLNLENVLADILKGDEKGPPP